MRDRRSARFLATLAAVYALLAGLKTVADFDLGWQMATARYIWTHKTIPSTALFSYTAHGAGWIYPVLAGFIFLAAYKVGGYALISWLCAICCAGTTAALSFGQNACTAALALVSVPVIAELMIPRSGMFTVLLFALFARLLLDYRQNRPAQLWLLPLLMALWVNLHLGFIAGIAVVIAYLTMEALDLPFRNRRAAVRARLQRAWPWLLAALAATLLNPWPLRIWLAVRDQEFPSRTEQALVDEFTPVPAMTRLFEWRNPENTIYWLLGVAVLATVAALWRRRFGPALVLLAAMCTVLAHARIAGPFVVLVCLLGGEELAAALRRLAGLSQGGAWWLDRARIASFALLAMLVAIRTADIVTNRLYLSSGQIVLFGAGRSWWLPEQAAAFLLDHHLPREVFSTFNLSSYLVWELGENYPDFDDGRYLPFGDDIFYEQRNLAQQPLDSPSWDSAARKHNIQTVIFPLSRFFALGQISLAPDCTSVRWKPVYIDTAAIVFVRRDALSDSLKALPETNCSTHDLTPPPPPQPWFAWGARAENYQARMNAAAIYQALGRIPEARAALQTAEQITDIDPTLYLQKADLAMKNGEYDEAEKQFRASLQRRPSDLAWQGLGLAYIAQQRYSEAVAAFQHSVKLAAIGRYQRLYVLGKAYVLAQQPSEALETLAAARAQSPFETGRSSEAAEFRAELAEAEAAAYAELGNPAEAIARQRRAVEETPYNARRWQVLAQAYRAAGMAAEADAASNRAQSLR